MFLKIKKSRETDRITGQRKLIPHNIASWAFSHMSSRCFCRLAKRLVKGTIRMRANRKLFSKISGTLTIPAQPVGANGGTPAEITHFSWVIPLQGTLSVF